MVSRMKAKRSHAKQAISKKMLQVTAICCVDVIKSEGAYLGVMTKKVQTLWLLPWTLIGSPSWLRPTVWWFRTSLSRSQQGFHFSFGVGYRERKLLLFLSISLE